jgi:hypothetical protein
VLGPSNLSTTWVFISAVSPAGFSPGPPHAGPGSLPAKFRERTLQTLRRRCCPSTILLSRRVCAKCTSPTTWCPKISSCVSSLKICSQPDEVQLITVRNQVYNSGAKSEVALLSDPTRQSSVLTSQDPHSLA